MKLQNLLYGALTAMAVSAFSVACTDPIELGDGALQKPSSSAITKDTVFSNAEYTRQFHTALYSRMFYGLPYGVDHKNYTLPESNSPYIGMPDALTDCWQLHWVNTVVYGTYYAASLTSTGSTLFGFTGEMVWETIHSAYLFLENIDGVPGIEQEEKNRLIAETKCIIASRYFDLFLHYGGLPLITSSFTGAESSYNEPRATIEATVNFMVGLLDDAIQTTELPWVVADPNTQTGRWTKAAAMALKCKVLQVAASPIYNATQPYYDGSSEAETNRLVWYGDYQDSRWQKLKTACEEFFNALNTNGYYELEKATGTTISAYRLAYRKGYAKQGSKEILLATRHAGIDAFKAGTYAWHQWVNIGRNSYTPTQEYVEMFPWSNGQPFDWEDAKTKYETNPTHARGLNAMFKRGTISPRSQMLTNVTYTRDPRLYEEVIVNGQLKYLDWTTGALSGDIWEMWVGGTDAQKNPANETNQYATGYCHNKYYMGSGSNGAGDYLRQFTQWVYLSLNEMYLIYAEALLQTGDLTGCLNQMKIIRQRVGINNNVDYYDSSLRTDKDKLLNELLNERARELGLQNIRWMDMVRYKRTDWMTKPLHGLRIYRLKQNANGGWDRVEEAWTNGDKATDVTSKEPNRFEYEKFELKERRRALWDYENDPNNLFVKKYLLSPIPQGEINKNYGLIQNPGW